MKGPPVPGLHVEELTPAPAPLLVMPAGYEPHSVLPVGSCMFTTYAQSPVPPSLTNTHIAVTGTVFLAPYMRNFLWWMGCRSASREVGCWHLLCILAGTSLAVHGLGPRCCRHPQRRIPPCCAARAAGAAELSGKRHHRRAVPGRCAGVLLYGPAARQGGGLPQTKDRLHQVLLVLALWLAFLERAGMANGRV